MQADKSSLQDGLVDFCTTITPGRTGVFSMCCCTTGIVFYTVCGLGQKVTCRFLWQDGGHDIKDEIGNPGLLAAGMINRG